MKMKGFISTLVFAANAVLALPTIASNVSEESLSPKARFNTNLDVGDYDFARVHAGYSSTFLDEWKFSLAETSDVSITLYDLAFPGGSSDDIFLSQGDGHDGKRGHNYAYPQISQLLDNQYLTFSLFDHNGSLLGSAGENDTLTALNLVAGEWYTLTVSAKVDGYLGSFYSGTLSVEPVPLGDSLPLFGSALLMLAIRRKQQSKERAQAGA